MAEPQGDAISWCQLLACGLTDPMIRGRVARGDLHRRHRAVYALGPRPRLSPYGESWLAALAAGDRGGLGGWSAAAAVGAADWPAHPEIIVVGGPLHVPGVTVLRTRTLDPADIYVDAAGLPFTWWPRTLTDLAARASVAELQGVLDRLERRGLLDLPQLDAAIGAARGRDGIAKLRRALVPWTTIPEAEYLSLLERFGALLLAAGDLPPHEMNGKVRLAGGRTIRVDVLFRGPRVAMELDGRDSHDRSVQFTTDRERDRELQKLGYLTPRFTWQDVRHRPGGVLGDLRALIAGRV